MKDTRGPNAILFGIGAGMVVVGPILIAINVPQTLEGTIFPTVSFDQVDVSNPRREKGAVSTKDTWRDKVQACFHQGITKLRSADIVSYTFFIVPIGTSKVSERIPIVPYLVDDKRHETDAALISHISGQHWVRHYCFEIPETVTDKQPMTVSGYALHRRHGLYDTPTPIKPFTIPALKKISDPDDQ